MKFVELYCGREGTAQKLQGWGILFLLLFHYSAFAAVLQPLGDLDDDGMLTTLDVSLLVNHMNWTNGLLIRTGATTNLPPDKLGYADVNGDGALSPDDVHRLVDGILGLPLNPFPRPVLFDPPPHHTNAAVPRLVVYFNEDLNTNLLLPNNITLVHLGRDNTFGTNALGASDDSNVLSGTLSYSNASAALVLRFPTDLPAGWYRATVQRPITDLAGRMMTRSYSWEFATLGGADNDGDGIPDYLEPFLPVYPGSIVMCDPTKFSTLGDSVPDGDRDADGDDLSNTEEIFHFTSLTNRDSDGDGWVDGVEVSDGKDPCNPASHPEWSVFGRPPIEIRLPDDEELGPANLGTIVGRPPVEITLPAAEEPLELSGPGTIVARPPVEIIRPAQDEAQGLVLGGIVARPPVIFTNVPIFAPNKNFN